MARTLYMNDGSMEWYLVTPQKSCTVYWMNAWGGIAQTSLPNF